MSSCERLQASNTQYLSVGSAAQATSWSTGLSAGPQLQLLSPGHFTEQHSWECSSRHPCSIGRLASSQARPGTTWVWGQTHMLLPSLGLCAGLLLHQEAWGESAATVLPQLLGHKWRHLNAPAGLYLQRGELFTKVISQYRPADPPSLSLSLSLYR